MNYLSSTRFYTMLIFIPISLFLLLLSNQLWIQGMFMDGTIYASVSKNLSLGIGSWWKLKMSETVFSEFYEQMPLAIWIQSLFFKIIGTSFFVERFYSLLTFFMSSLLIIGIWLKLNKSLSTAFLPLLFWVLISRVSWCVCGNMIENTLTIFVLLSVYFFISFKNQLKKSYRPFIFFIISVSLAFLTKGVVTLFVISMPILYGLGDYRKNLKSGLLEFITLLGVLISFFLLAYYLLNDFNEFFKNHWEVQIQKSISDVVTVSNRLMIIKFLFNEPAFAFALFILLYLSFRSKIKLVDKDKSWLFMFIGLVICGSIPFTLTLKQHPHYLTPIFPCLAIALSIAFDVPLSKLISESYHNIRLRSIALLLCTCLLSVGLYLNIKNFGKVSRDVAMVEDVKCIISYLGVNKDVAICNHHFSNWNLLAYLSRYGGISVRDYRESKYSYCIDNGSCADLASSYTKVIISTKEYHLYQRNE